MRDGAGRLHAASPVADSTALSACRELVVEPDCITHGFFGSKSFHDEFPEIFRSAPVEIPETHADACGGASTGRTSFLKTSAAGDKKKIVQLTRRRSVPRRGRDNGRDNGRRHDDGDVHRRHDRTHWRRRRECRRDRRARELPEYRRVRR